MKVIIIEDEKITADKLKRQLYELFPSVEVVCNLTSVSDSIEWFKHNSMPDLIFMDICLSDGISFLIFESVEIKCPIIFTTAYDEFALKAFEVSSIDYLLKPVDEATLIRAMDKYNMLVSTVDKNGYIDSIKSFIDAYNTNTVVRYPLSILVEDKDRLIPVMLSDIAYLYFSNKTVTIVRMDGGRNIVNGSLESYQQQLNPKEFYRANRQFIIAKKAVASLTLWFNNRLIVNLCVEAPERIIISRTKSADFKEWLTRL